ncbi:MAG: hypothetical protein WBK61_00705 [Bacillota bacterium]
MAILLLHNDQPSVEHLKKAAHESVVFSTTYITRQWDCIIRWGNSEGLEGSGFELNTASALKRLYSRTEAAKCLSVNKIPFRSRSASADSAPPTVSYRIHIVDMEPIAVTSQEGGKFKTVSNLTSPKVDRAIRLARRVLYSLGLHFGRVDLYQERKKTLKVLTVSAAPRITKKLAVLYMDAFVKALERRRQSHSVDPDDVVLGADPEFMMISPATKRVIFASDFFPKEGLIGYDSQSYFRDRRNYPIAEIRPRPNTSPAQLVREIKEALAAAAQKTHNVNSIWLAGSSPYKGYTTGGHIHFTGVPLTTDLIRTLDNYLAIPCMLIEHPVRASTRRPKYGFIGDVRTKPHGGFEYRVPASWLVSRRVAEGVLHLAKLVVIEHKNLTMNLLGTTDAVSDFYKARKDRFRPHIDKLWADIERTPYYQTHRKQIRVIKRLIDSKKIWRDRSDIRKNWGV